MAIIGDGTIDSPYVVDTWDDFMSKKDEEDCYILFSDSPDKIIDLNSIEDFDGYSSFTIAAKSVDFNNWTIRNFVFTGSYINFTGTTNTPMKIKNCTFENIYFNGSTNLLAVMHSSQYGVVELHKCKIYGRISNTNSIEVPYKGCVKIYNSSCVMTVLAPSINIKNNLYGSNGHFRMYNCNIKDVINFTNGSGSSDVLLHPPYMSRCAYTLTAKTTISSIDQRKIHFNNGSYYTPIIVYSDDVPISFDANNTTSVYNSSFSTITSGETNIISVTDEQFKNPDYLFERGFDIAGGE